MFGSRSISDASALSECLSNAPGADQGAAAEMPLRSASADMSSISAYAGGGGGDGSGVAHNDLLPLNFGKHVVSVSYAQRSPARRELFSFFERDNKV